MKKIYAFLAVFLMSFYSFSQCVIDSNFLLTANGGMYPAPDHMPHIVLDSLYDQTVQGKITDTLSFGMGLFGATIIVDSVRLDSVNGLPTGINWVHNPNVLPGGGYGCVEFTGTTTDTAGVYNISAVGMTWARLIVPILGIDVDTFQYGSLNMVPPFRNYYLVVDPTQLALGATATSTVLCFGMQNGTVTAFATGGSPIAPYTYSWNTGDSSYTLNSVGNGTYTVTVTSGTETATATAVVTTESSPITLTVTDSASTGSNGSATVSVSGGQAPYQVFWSNRQNTNTITGLAPGTYNVTVVDSNGCFATDSAVVDSIAAGIWGLNNASAQITLFPNPANNLLNVVIEAQQLMNGQIRVVDATGRMVYTDAVSGTGNITKKVNLEQLSPGIYTLQLTSQNQQAYRKFVVTH